MVTEISFQGFPLPDLVAAFTVMIVIALVAQKITYGRLLS
jgi:hypothetical protein